MFYEINEKLSRLWQSVFFPPLSKTLDPRAAAGWATQQVHWRARGGVSAGTRPDLCPGSKFWTWTEWRGHGHSIQFIWSSHESRFLCCAVNICASESLLGDLKMNLSEWIETRSCFPSTMLCLLLLPVTVLGEEHFIMYRCPFSCSLLRTDTSMTTGKTQAPTTGH